MMVVDGRCWLLMFGCCSLWFTMFRVGLALVGDGWRRRSTRSISDDGKFTVGQFRWTIDASLIISRVVMHFMVRVCKRYAWPLYESPWFIMVIGRLKMTRGDGLCCLAIANASPWQSMTFHRDRGSSSYDP